MENSFEIRRLAKLQEAVAELEQINKDFHDADTQKDKSENDTYDVLKAKKENKERYIAYLNSLSDVVYIPGTWNVGDKLKVRYTRIVSYGKDLEVPDKEYTIELDIFTDITSLPLGSTPDSLELIPVSIDSPLGKALLNKAHKSFRFPTNSGYCEVEVERVII